MTDHGFSEDEARAWREQGFVVRPAVLAPRELTELREAVEGIHAAIERAAGRGDAPVEQIDDKRYQELLGSTVKWEWREGSREIRSMEPFHHLDARIDRLIDDARLWQPVCSLIGDPSPSLFTDKLNFKRPGGSPFPWHQDTPYWAFGCEHTERLASLQLYLDEATKENGCLWVIPKSHRQGALPVFQDRGVLGRLYTDLSQFEGEPPQAIEAPAGSVIWFHGDLVHGSRRNRTRENRRAIVLTYQPGGHPRWRREVVRPVGSRKS